MNDENPTRHLIIAEWCDALRTRYLARLMQHLPGVSRHREISTSLINTGWY
jgi:hypothetical protein